MTAGPFVMFQNKHHHMQGCQQPGFVSCFLAPFNLPNVLEHAQFVVSDTERFQARGPGMIPHVCFSCLWVAGLVAQRSMVCSSGQNEACASTLQSACMGLVQCFDSWKWTNISPAIGDISNIPAAATRPLADPYHVQISAKHGVSLGTHWLNRNKVSLYHHHGC